jgi:hypothetical protein
VGWAGGGRQKGENNFSVWSGPNILVDSCNRYMHGGLRIYDTSEVAIILWSEGVIVRNMPVL